MTNLVLRSRRAGFALALTIIMIVGLTVISTGAVIVGMSSTLVRGYHWKADELGHAADAALETSRALLNADRSLYPDSGYGALEVDAPVQDLEGYALPGVTRSTYVGPVGITSGQYGVFGAVISVVRSGPNTAIRRAQIVQESFAKFAYFTDVEPSTIAFGGGDQLYGPVHSNDVVRIYSSGATFHGRLTTAETISGSQYGTFRQGFTEGAGVIPMPEMADLEKLQVQAAAGGTSFTGSTSAVGRATTRIEFVAIDLNGDGDTTDANEGFIRVYSSPDDDWVVGAVPVNDMVDEETCGDYHAGAFVSADAHNEPGWGGHSSYAALGTSSRRCYLGGDSALFNQFRANDGTGSWQQWSGTVSPLLDARDDRNYLFPITREMNAGFKGVVFVDGDVAVSGTVRGRVTVAATGDIIIADDLRYSVDPSVGSCEDIIGLFAGGDVVIPYTPLVAPWRRDGGSYLSFGETPDEFVHGFILTLNQFTVQSYASGSSEDEPCQTNDWGRGCLYLTGGIIQRQRGPVGTSGGTGYVKRYSYDGCGASAPPPYFPTTGNFTRSQYYDVDPTGFDINAYFDMLTAGT
ncbi:MAG: hypothetical protein WEF86_13565 [Gemmatimonadota bacterium]